MKLSILIPGLLIMVVAVLMPTSALAQDSQLVYGQQVSGFITRIDDADRYQFSGQEGDVISITVRRTNGNLDPVVELIDSGFRILTVSDDHIGTDSAIVNFSLPYTGPYLIRVEGFDKSSGDYILNLYNGEPPTDRLTVSDTRIIYNGDITYGQTVRDTLGNANPFALWQFFGSAGDTISATMVVDEVAQGSFAFDPLLYLIDPTGRLIGMDDDSVQGQGANMQQDLGINGIYTLMATSYKQRTFGSYQLTLALVNPPQPVVSDREPVLTAPPAASARLGGIDVQSYCRAQGYNAILANDGRNWACSSGGNIAFVLQQRDFDAICRSTYTNVQTFAVLSGESPTVAYNWACYTTDRVILPTATPPPSQYAGTLRPRDNVEVHVRSGPGLEFDSLGVIDWRQSFPFYLQEDGWYVIDFNGRRGYVSTRWATVTLTN